ncbi:discoidin domain-containing protein [Paenibacillus sp. J2TS4]|uniref:discoidin domain-containing protein n=1 Tax=Paenibacillus sp. J2TS4 TaxID=2807194 RepID=UPI001B1571A9|nr:discoidin domain-containing protein [Paenibacillus sp. J2TS4]GIP32594.1 hypothetical protein J2TS4_18040 [Paenibacillus sp. J2TS4]
MAVVIRSEKELDFNNGIKKNVEIVDGKLQLEVVGNGKIGYKSVIVQMTSDNVPSPYRAVASGRYDVHHAFKAFDKNAGTGWRVSGSSGWIYYDFGPGNEQIITKYEIMANPTSSVTPKSWILEGSNDADEWTILDEKISTPTWSNYETRSYEIVNQTAFRYHRLTVRDGSNYTGIGEFDLLVDNISSLYRSSGTMEFPKIDLGQFYREIKSISSIKNLPEGSNVKVYTSTSNDNINFSEFSLVDSEGLITSPQGRYIKVKLELIGKQSESQIVQNEFTESETSQFEQDEQLIFDGSLRLRTDYVNNMHQDLSWQYKGEIFRKSIGKTDFRKIDKIRIY